MASLSEARRLVVKIGSALLVDDAGALRSEWLSSLCADVADLRARGVDVVLVSSGSIALGRGILGLPRGTLPLEHSQAAASVGQIRLARAYQETLAPMGITAAQILVTLEDSADRRRYLNSRATLETLLDLGAVPIVNENDTVATDEIRYGDNDRLAAQVAATVGADQLVILSDVDGLYSANPQQNPTATRYDIVTDITPDIEAQAGDAASSLSRGGMRTKVMAAKIATQAGCAMCVSSGSPLNPLQTLRNGGACTWFIAQKDPQSARKSWIASMKPQGRIWVDDGAVHALKSGKSLLPAGVMRRAGDIARGDPVEILTAEDVVVGVGFSAYTGDEIDLIKGRQTSDIAGLLGHPGRSTLIHRDDMSLTI